MFVAFVCLFVFCLFVFCCCFFLLLFFLLLFFCALLLRPLCVVSLQFHFSCIRIKARLRSSKTNLSIPNPLVVVSVGRSKVVFFVIDLL